MKKYSYLMIVVISSFLFSSCNQQTTTTAVTTTKTTVTEPSSDGFIFKKVIKGDTIWGYSEEVYGTGFEWRQIVAENPFLGEHGRIYYDQAKGKWIVIIKPGEKIKIGGKYVSPTFISEEITTKTTTTSSSSLDSVLWWEWLCIIGCIAFLVWLFGFYRQNSNNSAFASSSSSVHVNIRNGIDLDTHRTLLIRDQDFRDRTLKVLEAGAANGRLKGFFV